MKKIIAITLALLLLVSILAGCSISEIGYLNTLKGMASLQNYSFSGTISANIDNLTVDSEALGIPQDVIDTIKTQLSSTQIIYDGTENKAENALTFNLKTKTSDDKITNIFNFMLDKENIAFNKDAAELILPSVPGGTPKTVNGVTYTQYDLSDLISYLESTVPPPPEFNIPINPYAEGTTDYYDYDSGSFTGYFDGFDNSGEKANYDDTLSTDPTIYATGYDDGYAAGLADADVPPISPAYSLLPYLQSLTADPIPASLTAKINKLCDDFVNITCNGLSFNNITKLGDNSYKLSLKNGDIADMLVNTIKYFISNPKKLSDLLLGEDMQSGFIGSLTQDEINAAFGSVYGDLYDPEAPIITKQDLQSAVFGMLSQLLQTSMDEMDSSLADFKNQINSMFDYTFTNTLSKLGDQKYECDSVFTLETKQTKGNSLPISTKLAVNMTLSVNGITPIVPVIKPNDPVPVPVPVPVDTTKDIVPHTGLAS